MKLRTLGRSGLRVSDLCLGTMTFGEDWGWGAGEAECRRILDRFAEAGGNFIDTANSYTNGTSERFLGSFLGSERDRFVLASKFSHTNRPGDANAAGNHRKSLVQSVEGSLRRLRTGYLDLLWVHAWDALTPVEETMRALDDLVARGKVLYVGISDAPAWIAARANTLADLRGWTAFAGLQVEYSLIARTAERELLPMARSLGLGITAWAPLGAGLLTGKYNDGPTREPASRIDVATEFFGGLRTDRNLAVARQVAEVAQRVGRPAAAVALAWLRAQGDVIPIVGARTVGQLAANLTCLDFDLADPEIAALEALTRPELGFPHDFLASDPVRYLLYSGEAERLGV